MRLPASMADLPPGSFASMIRWEGKLMFVGRVTSRMRDVAPLGVPSPLVGEGQGGGCLAHMDLPALCRSSFLDPAVSSDFARPIVARWTASARTPLPSPPPQGGREQTCAHRATSTPIH